MGKDRTTCCFPLFEPLSSMMRLNVAAKALFDPAADGHDVDSATEGKDLTPKQKKRLEEKAIRDAKKKEKREKRAMQKERKAAEREHKEELRERQLEEERLANEGLSAKEMEEQKRIEEERILFEKEFAIEQKPVTDHTKKSTLESNRLGGHHMA